MNRMHNSLHVSRNPHPSRKMPTLTVYSTPDLARELGFNTSSVYRAIRKLEIRPQARSKSGQAFYGEDTLKRLRAIMKPENRDRHLGE